MMYKVKITELLSRTIIVDAENEKEAEQITENLVCDEGIIVLSYDDYSDRYIKCIGEANELDCDLFEAYETKGEMRNE